MAGLFITGTDTGVGKTWVTCQLAHWLRRQGLKVATMKPVATGCVRVHGRLRNEDALRLGAASSLDLPYDQINPYAFQPPISPHIAARLDGQEIDLGRIVAQARELETRADLLLVEGVGGFEAPLNERERVSHLARALGMPVLLVVALRLGCLNHAILSHQAIVTSGARLGGWLANQPFGNFPFLDENIQTLKSTLTSPYLGLFPHENQHLKEFSETSEEAFPSTLDEDEILRIFNG